MVSFCGVLLYLCLVNGLKLDWKCYPLLFPICCFHPVVTFCGVLLYLCLVSGLKLDWKCYPLLFPPRGILPVVSTPWYPVCGFPLWSPSCCFMWCLCGILHGLRLEIRLEMPLSVVSTLSCLVYGLKLDWKSVFIVSPK